MKLNFKVFGKGEPIIILHGMFGTLDNWQTIAQKLAKDYMVYIIDQRNHGRSPHSDDFSYDIMTNDLKEFMEENWIFEATIIGHSMGGKVAMQFATEYPDMVKKLIIVDIAPRAYKGNHKPIFAALLALDLDTLSSRKEASDFLITRIKNPAVRQFLLKNLSINKQTGKYEWKMNLPVIYAAYQHILGKNTLLDPYEGDTLFIKGDKSDYIDENKWETYQEFFPKAQLETIKNAGHWVHAEQAKSFLACLQSFLLN